MKKLFYSAAAVLLALGGCNDNQNTEDPVGNISLDATALRESRAAIADVATLEADETGFKVWGTAADKPDEWYAGDGGEVIDGSNNHVFGSDRVWDFVTKVKWPAEATAYPMNFYALWPATPAGLAMNSQTPDDLSAAYAVQSTAAAQIDLMGAHVATGAFKPSNDVLNITFKHLLSKVNYGFRVETGYDVRVQALSAHNVAAERIYNFIAEEWTAASAPQAEDCTARYIYLGTLNGQSAIKGSVTQFTGNDTDTPIYTAADNASLMLIPQNVTDQKWVPDGGLPGSKAYVRVVYRIQREGVDYIGMARASDHPDYAGSQAATADYDGELFVVVGYPFTLDWEAGKGYTYNIALPGTSGGILLEPTYVDETGTSTGLSINNLDAGDPILGDGYIHLVPEVESWTDMTPNDLL